MPPKTTCPITRADFLAHAKPITIDLGGHPITAEPREFSTGSFGWYVNAKSPIKVDGKRLSVQVGMNLIVVGSKDQPRSAAAEAGGAGGGAGDGGTASGSGEKP